MSSRTAAFSTILLCAALVAAQPDADNPWLTPAKSAAEISKPATNYVEALIQEGRLDSASSVLITRLEIDSTDSTSRRLLGRVAFLRGDYAASVLNYDKAFPISLEDYYSFGTSLGCTGNHIRAVEVLTKGQSIEGDAAIKRRLNGNLHFYEMRLLDRAAREALQAETNYGDTALDPAAIAVVTFKNAGDSRYDPLQKGLADMVITDLSQVISLKVVERVMTQKISEELALSQTGATENDTRVRTARILRAARVVGGTFKGIDTSSLGLRGGFVDTKTGAVTAVDKIDGTPAKFFELEKRFVFNLIDKLGIRLTEAERRQIEVIPTENILAFLAYSKGLDAEDRGDFAAAQGFYAEAAQQDPSFAKAQTAQEIAGAIAAEQKILQPVAQAPAPHPAGATELTQAVTVQSQPVIEEPQQPAAVVPAAPAAQAASAPAPVFTIGDLSFSATGPAALSSINAATANFMPERPIAGTGVAGSTGDAQLPASSVSAAQRNSFTDAKGIGLSGGNAMVKARVPIP
jgi:TolB-like protein